MEKCVVQPVLIRHIGKGILHLFSGFHGDKMGVLQALRSFCIVHFVKVYRESGLQAISFICRIVFIALRMVMEVFSVGVFFEIFHIWANTYLKIIIRIDVVVIFHFHMHDYKFGIHGLHCWIFRWISVFIQWILEAFVRFQAAVPVEPFGNLFLIGRIILYRVFRNGKGVLDLHGFYCIADIIRFYSALCLHKRYFQFFSYGKEIIVRQRLRLPFFLYSCFFHFTLRQHAFDLFICFIRNGGIQDTDIQPLGNLYRFFHRKMAVHIENLYKIPFVFIEQHCVHGLFITVYITAFKQEQCDLHAVDIQLLFQIFFLKPMGEHIGVPQADLLIQFSGV